MGGEGAWTQAPENTLESLRHAIQQFDGIEFDIRITADNQLVVHHDRDVSLPASYLEGKPIWAEEWTLEELKEAGFLGFEEMLDDPIITNHWATRGKMGCIEIKRPHPTASSGGGYRGKKHHIAHVARAMQMAESILDERDIPHHNTVFYAFHKHMPASAAQASTRRPWAALIPYIPPFGNRTTQRLQAVPQYISMPFKRLVKRHKMEGSSMLPCAIEYFKSPTSWLPLGRKVSLRGRGLERLTASRHGMPTYVWPTRPDIEHALLRAGLTALTDYADPALTWLPSNQARWVQPATQPLDEEQWQSLEKCEVEHHLDVLSEFKDSTPTWSEADPARRRSLIEAWRKRWKWNESTEELLEKYCDATPPWAAPRMIGHRGSGKTSRPVLQQPHSM
ncbi:MAG: glycerophosphodiester phosphodiesterase [Poseidonia sp.]